MLFSYSAFRNLQEHGMHQFFYDLSSYFKISKWNILRKG